SIDFFANTAEAGKTNIHDSSYANVNISAKGDDDVVIIKDKPNAGDVTVQVKHDGGPPTGSEDDYVVKNGYATLNINGNPASVTFEDKNGTQVGKGTDASIPDGFKGVTLNGATPADSTTGGAATAEQNFQDFLTALGKTPQQFLSALKGTGYNFATVDDLMK